MLDLLPLTTMLASNLQDMMMPILLFGGLALICAALMMRIAKRGRRRVDPNIPQSEKLERLRQQAAVKNDMSDLMVEIEQMAKRLGHQLDAKAIELEQLISEADHRLSRFKHLAERLEKAGESQVFENPAAPTPEPVNEAEALAAAARAVEQEDVSSSNDPASEALTRRVYELAEEGKSANEIAQELEEHTGKIELILSLRPSSGDNG